MQKRRNRKTINRSYVAKIKLSGKGERTSEGFLILDVVIAQKKVLQYPEYGTRELLGDDIFSDAYLASCDGCPFVLRHPTDRTGAPVDVMPENYKEFVKGVIYGPTVDKANQRVLGKLRVWDPEVIEMIEDGELEELSQGYVCKVVDEPGVYDGDEYDLVQTNVIMNHLALVDAGRAGDAVKVLTNGQPREITAKDIERIERRRKNMKKLNGKKANGDGDGKDEQLDAGNQNPQNAGDEGGDGEEKPKSVEQRLDGLEKMMNTLAKGMNTLLGTANGDGDGEDTPPKKDENGRGNEGDDKDEKEKMNKVNSRIDRLEERYPEMVNNAIFARENAIMQGRVLLGEDVQDLLHLTRINKLPEFRKEVLKRNGLPKEKVEALTDAQAQVYLDVLTDNTKMAMLGARTNADGSEYQTADGSEDARARSDF